MRDRAALDGVRSSKSGTDGTAYGGIGRLAAGAAGMPLTWLRMQHGFAWPAAVPCLS